MTTLKDDTEDEDTTQTTFESVSKTSTPNTVSPILKKKYRISNFESGTISHGGPENLKKFSPKKNS